MVDHSTKAPASNAPPPIGGWPGRPAALLLAGLTLGMAGSVLDAAGDKGPLQKTVTQELLQPFKGKPDPRQGWELFGRNAETSVLFEEGGLRITLPPSPPKGNPPAGVTTRLAVCGDLEITMRFELLKEPE